jgi:hypothetical protein
MTWNNQTISKLTQLVNEGKSSQEIADVLGITRNMVIGKAHRMGLKLKYIRVAVIKRPAPRLKADLTVLSAISKNTDKWGWGLEFDEIEEYTGFGTNVVLAALKRLLGTGHINKCHSAVADHLFFNDNSVKQK